MSSQPVWLTRICHTCAGLSCALVLPRVVLCLSTHDSLFSGRSISLFLSLCPLLCFIPTLLSGILFLSLGVLSSMFCLNSGSCMLAFLAAPLFMRLECLAARLQLKAQLAHKTRLLRLGPQGSAHQGCEVCHRGATHSSCNPSNESLSLFCAPGSQRPIHSFWLVAAEHSRPWPPGIFWHVQCLGLFRRGACTPSCCLCRPSLLALSITHSGLLLCCYSCCPQWTQQGQTSSLAAACCSQLGPCIGGLCFCYGAASGKPLSYVSALAFGSAFARRGRSTAWRLKRRGQPVIAHPCWLGHMTLVLS
jgi:hypothetical protein